MKRFIPLALSVMFAFVMSCKNTPCSKVQVYTDKAASAFSVAMSCKHPEVLQKLFIDKCAEKGWCKKDALTGAIAMIVCPIVVPLVVQGIVMMVPPEAECSGAMTEAGALALCNLIPF